MKQHSLQGNVCFKEIGASYYIGDTNVQNEWMKDVFEENGCQLLSSTSEICEKF